MNNSPRWVIAAAALAGALLGGGAVYLAARGPGEAASGAVRGADGAGSVKGARKLLYYRNPMGLPDTSPVPKKDPMGMDYIPVYEGEDPEADRGATSQVRISTEKVQKLGVRTEPARVQRLERTVRAAGRVEPDERRVYTISPKFEGYVERLQVNATGQPVARGQVLFDAYSPELVSAQREYQIALQGLQNSSTAADSVQAGMRRLADSSLQRLRNWDIADEQIAALTTSGEVRRTLAFKSPVNGLVTEKKAVQGMRFMPGESLYQVTDLSSVWVIADVFEQDIGAVKAGMKARVSFDAYPDKVYTGNVTYVYPTLNADTRTIPVRIEIANPGLRLKPAMYAQVELAAAGSRQAVTVPASAVIDSGTRQLVLVQLGEGRFEPREVRLGQRGVNDVEVLEGVKDGESVVVSANFLIDAESNLKAAVGSFGHGGHAAPAKTVGHSAEGTIESIDLKAGALTVSHGPVPSLKWPAMSMEFAVANSTLLQGYQAGDAVAFEFVERQPGEWVVTSLQHVKAGAAAGHPSH
jgi:Cu(I)/Ag(I) efflux system membrane fusion protein